MINSAKLVQARMAKAMSQEEVGIACNLSGRTIQRIEAGSPPSLESVKALVSLFGSDILGGNEEPSHGPTAPVSWQASILHRYHKIRRRSVAAYGLIATSIILLIGKIIWPAGTGLYVRDGDVLAFGITRPGSLGAAHEVLGWWLLPLCTMILAAGVWLRNSENRISGTLQ